MNKLICSLFATIVFALPSHAQRFCGTDELYNKLKAENPKIGEVELSLGVAIQQAILDTKATGKYSKTTGIVYDVPIVVHIVHDYGFENLSDDDIFSAVEYWDKVFNAQNSDTIDVIPTFKNYIGNAEIRLRLATKDPLGNPTKGITRRQSYTTTRGGDGAKVDYWPNDKYINIWFVNKFDASHSGAAAYAYKPASAAFFPHYDGLISVYSYFDRDKTVPHELGHVLNLDHPWGGTNNPGIACGDDAVPDTPPTYGHSSCSATDLYDTRCASTGYTDAVGVFIPNSPLAPDTTNTQNIMDYSFCAKMFTIGQTARMRASITSPTAGRNNLITSANLVATGALLPRPELKPIADFSVERGQLSFGQTSERAYFLCQNSTTKFVFRNRSWNDTVTDVAWSFSNNPSSPTSSILIGNVTNGFKDAGWATVTLAATGNNSGTSTINRQAVYVASTNAYGPVYYQFFNSPGDFNDWPMFNYYNNNFKWEFYPTNGHTDWRGCIRYRSFDARSTPESYSQKQEGDFDDIFTPAIDLSSFGSGSVNLNFYTSGCSTSLTNAKDSMEIFASNTCGDSWVKISNLGYTALVNTIGRNTEFVPAGNDDWRAQTINVPASVRSDKTFFRLRFWPAIGGNNLYLDNFSVSPWTTEIKSVQQTPNEVKLIPNPTANNTKLCFTTSNGGEANYMVRDVTGKMIFQKNIQVQPNTFVQEDIARSIFPSTGIYLITLTQSNQSTTNKLVIQ